MVQWSVSLGVTGARVLTSFHFRLSRAERSREVGVGSGFRWFFELPLRGDIARFSA